MTALAWDKPGERVYQSGVDRGVLYLHDGRSVVWNGLTSVEEDSTAELSSYYLDGVKYLDNLLPGDFVGKLKAFTYPEEFEQVNGQESVSPGLIYYNQPFKSFGLSYRTMIGNDIDGKEHGYKIHLLYNIVANPDNYVFGTFDRSTGGALEFSWTLTGTPSRAANFRPTVHISIDSLRTPDIVLKTLEDTLYGTDSVDPHLPTIDEITSIFGYAGALIIIDNGDGTWTAIDDSNTYITMINDTTFQIDNADVTMLDSTTYEISTTNP